MDPEALAPCRNHHPVKPVTISFITDSGNIVLSPLPQGIVLLPLPQTFLGNVFHQKRVRVDLCRRRLLVKPVTISFFTDSGNIVLSTLPQHIT